MHEREKVCYFFFVVFVFTSVSLTLKYCHASVMVHFRCDLKTLKTKVRNTGPKNKNTAEKHFMHKSKQKN